MTEVHELDALAAEYVLGTLDAPERAHSLLLLGSNDTFAAKVKEWERRLGELHLMVEPVEPEWQVWERVRAKIGGFESIPFFKLTVADKITPEPEAEQAAPDALPLPVPPEPNPLEAKPLESASPEPGSQAPAAPAPESAQVAPVSPPPAAREPESEHFVPMPVLAASRERVPAAAGAAADADVTRWRRSVRQWQALALLMTLVALVLAGLVAALRNFPDRLPPGLRLPFQATAAIPPGRAPRPPAPPVAQFDE
jgi:hypothetical protein